VSSFHPKKKKIKEAKIFNTMIIIIISRLLIQALSLTTLSNSKIRDVEKKMNKRRKTNKKKFTRLLKIEIFSLINDCSN